jgi:protein OS-9
MIKETSTCSYLMIIYTPRLCNDVAFQPPQENLAHPVSCQPVIPESDVDAWTSQRLIDRVTETERLLALENDNPLRDMKDGAEGTSRRGPVVGGTEVGAQIFVGSEGKVIEKGVVAGGGKETYVATVATSDGKTMSAAEMKKVNIQDPKDVEKLKKNVQKLAGRKAWRLELVDTPRGREFRAIIEADDEPEKKEKVDGGEEKGRGIKKEGEIKGEAKEKAYDADVEKADIEKEDDEKVEEGSEEVFKDDL